MQSRFGRSAIDGPCPGPKFGPGRSQCRHMLRATYGDLCCAQNYVALGRMWAPLQGDRGLPAQHNFGPVDGSRATRTARLVRHRPGLVSRRPNASEHASLEFRAGLDLHVSRVERLMVGRQRDGRDVKPTENMLR
jgi:hypothetical protein